MRVIIYTLNGSVHRVTPAIVADVPKGVDYKIIENDLMPSHIFRNAWNFSGGKVGVDIPKAKEVAHAIRRERRAEYMADNLTLISKDALGVPLKLEESAATAKQDNADYKANVDDVSQVNIDSSKNESELLVALS